MSCQTEDGLLSFEDDDTNSQSSSFGSLMMTPSSSDSDSQQPKLINNMISDLTDRIKKVAHHEGVISEREACLQTQWKDLAEREEAIKMREQDTAFESLSAVAKLKSALAALNVSDATEAIIVVFDWTMNIIERYTQRRLQQAETTASLDLPKAEDHARSVNNNQPAQDNVSVSEPVYDPERKTPSEIIKSQPVNKDGAIGLPSSVLRKAASLPDRAAFNQVDAEIPSQIGNKSPPKPLRVPSWWDSFGKTSSSESETSTVPPPPQRTWPVKDVLAGPDVRPVAAIESQNKGKAPETDETEICSNIKPKRTDAFAVPRWASARNNLRPVPIIKLKFSSPSKKSSTPTVDIESQKNIVTFKLAGTSQRKSASTKDSKTQPKAGTRTFKVPEVDSDKDSEADMPTAKTNVESKKASTRSEAKEDDATLKRPVERIGRASKHAGTTSDGANNKSNAVKLQHNKISFNVQEAPNDPPAFDGADKPNFPSLESEWNNEVEQLERDFDIGTRGFIRPDGTILKMIDGNPTIVRPTADKHSSVNSERPSGVPDSKPFGIEGRINTPYGWYVYDGDKLVPCPASLQAPDCAPGWGVASQLPPHSWAANDTSSPSKPRNLDHYHNFYCDSSQPVPHHGTGFPPVGAVYSSTGHVVRPPSTSFQPIYPHPPANLSAPMPGERHAMHSQVSSTQHGSSLGNEQKRQPSSAQEHNSSHPHQSSYHVFGLPSSHNQMPPIELNKNINSNDRHFVLDPHRSGRSIGQERNQFTSPFAFPQSQVDLDDGNISSFKQQHWGFDVPSVPQNTTGSGKLFFFGQPTNDPSSASTSHATQAVVGKQAKHSDSGLFGRSPDTAKARGNQSFSFGSGPSSENANQGGLGPSPFATSDKQGDNSLFGPRPSSFKQGVLGASSNTQNGRGSSGVSFAPSPFAANTSNERKSIFDTSNRVSGTFDTSNRNNRPFNNAKNKGNGGDPFGSGGSSQHRRK